MPKVTTITGGTAEFFEGIAQKEQGCKATYTRGNITFYVLVDDSVMAFYRNEVKALHNQLAKLYVALDDAKFKAEQGRVFRKGAFIVRFRASMTRPR